jgi:hypothetical protein
LWSQRLLAAILLGGQVMLHLLKGKINRRNTLDQMAAVGPESLLIALLTAGFVGMVFTIQVAREFINLGAGNVVGGVLALSLTRELGPVLTAVIVTGRVGSAFAAEIGTMQVTDRCPADAQNRPDRLFSHSPRHCLLLDAANFNHHVSRHRHPRRTADCYDDVRHLSKRVFRISPQFPDSVGYLQRGN